MRRANIGGWPPGIFSIAILVLLLLLPHGAASALPAGAGDGGSGSQLIALSLPNSEVMGGAFLTGQVELTQPAPKGGAKVKVTSDTKLVKISPFTPSSLLVPEGSTTVSFKVITSPVGNEVPATLTAAYGSASASVKLTLAPNGVASVTAEPATLQWGGSASVEVRLKDNAPKDVPYYKNVAPSGAPAVYESQVQKGGATVVLKSSNPAVKVPASVKILPGEISAKFTATASEPSSCSAGGPANPVIATITGTWEQPGSAPLTVGTNNQTQSRYTSKTILIDPKTIIGVSHDAHALVLNGSDKCVQALKAGNVMFLKNLGVLTVVKTMKTPQKQIAVAVNDASLTDFINEGTFQIFSQVLGPASEPSGSWTQGLTPDETQTGADIWKYKVSGTSNNYSFTAFKQNGGLSASITANGKAKGGYNFLAVIHGAKLQQATYKVPTDGTLEVNWVVQTTASGQGIGESRLRLPALYSGLVDSADYIPLLFQIYANLIFKPGFGEKAAAQGSFKITFSGEAGFDGTQPLNEGLDATADISSTTSSALAPHGVVAAINAPKFALSLSTVSFLWALQNRLPSALNAEGANLADSLQSQLGSYVKPDLMPPKPDELFKLQRSAWVMWVSSVAYAGAGSLAMLPCQQYYQTFVASAGVDKDMLGSASVAIPEDSGVQAFKKEKTTLIPAVKGCEPKK